MNYNLQEIASNPQLFIEGASRFDVQQGELGKQNKNIILFKTVCNIYFEI